MKILKFVIISILLSLMLGCITTELLTRNYYVLEYFKHTEKNELKQTEPYEASVYVMDAEIPKSYKRKQLVVRHFGPRITYSDYELWGVDLSKSIPDLVASRLSSYNIFSKTQREFWNTRPEFEIMIYINSLELNKSASIYQARLNISFILKETGNETHLVKYSVNDERALLAKDLDTYVQTINEMILEQSDNFIRKILVFQNKLNIIKETELDGNKDSSIIAFEEEQTFSGKGLLLLPALSGTDNEPYYIIKDQKGNEKNVKPGEEVPLKEGNYKISYGSGNEKQRMKKEKVEIRPRYKTIIEPNWGCLIIDIIDENRNFAKVRYEIFNLKNGESFGSEFPAEEEVGEQDEIWMLEPGLYKITVNNEPFNAYRDFTTVKVEKGKLRDLTIVMDIDDDGNPTNLIGSGILGDSFLEVTSQKINISSAIHGNFNFNSDNENTENQEYSLALNGQLDNRLIYKNGAFNYTLKHLMEIGVTKEYDDDFHLATDDFDLKNTGIYYFLENLGFYGRFDLNTHLFDKKEAGSDTTEIVVEPSLFPLKLKEGFGINYRILKSSKANLNIRSGLGFRQDFNNDVLELIDYDNNSYKYENKSNTVEKGIEFSAIGNFKLPFNLSYSTNIDVLFPFQKDENSTYEWENIFNLKLFKYISLDYKLKLENKVDNDIITKHSLFLRLTYFLK